MLKRFIFFVSFILFFATSLLANPLDHRFQKAFKVQRLSIEQGLSQSVVYKIIQDSYGYIWVATEDGLNRFDGYEFEVFEHKHSDPNSLHENLIYTLYEDVEVGIWIGTQNGLSFFDFNSQHFINYNLNQASTPTGIVELANIDKNKLLIGAENGLFILNKLTNKISPFVSNTGVTFQNEILSFDTNEENVFFAIAKCVYSIEKKSLELNKYCHPKLSSMLKDRTLKTIKLNKGHLWMGTTDGLIDLELDTQQLRLYQHNQNNPNSISANWIQDLEIDNNGNLWIGSTGGADVYHFSTSHFEHFRHQIYNSDGLSSNDVITIYSDQEGLVWLGTYTGGLNILDPQQTGFKHILTKSDLAEIEATNAIHGISKDNKDNLWLASFGGGLIRFDLMTGNIDRPFNQQILQMNANFSHIYSLLTDLEQRLWVGTVDGLFVLDLKNNKLMSTQILVDNVDVKFDQYIFQTYQDHSGRIWIGTLEGLYLIDRVEQVGDKLILLLTNKTSELPETYLKNNHWVTSILETQNEDLWIGGQSGLAMYSKKDESWRHFQYEMDNQQSLSYNDVQSLFEDSRGILWVGTANGLNKVNREHDENIYFERITKENGLANNSIYGILEDNNKQLWLSTNLGLIRYSQRSEQMQSFRQTDGLSSNEFNKGAFFSDYEGVLYFGSINGVTIVDNKIYSKNPREKKLKLAMVKIDDRLLDVHALNQQDNPTIEKFENEDVVSFTVTDLYYRKLDTQFYRYRLLGLNEQWVNLEKERRFMFANLPVGNYQLEIQSRIVNEEWPNNSLKVKLKINGNYWKSQQALYLIIIFTLLIFLSLIYSVYRYYKGVLLKRDKLLAIESLHLKESKQESVELEKELVLQLSQIDNLQNELSNYSQLITEQQFKESVTGFIRFDNVAQILSSKNKTLSQYNFILQFHISNLNSIVSQFGDLASIEIITKITSELKKMVPANINIFYLSDESFLLLGNADKNKNIISSLLDLRMKFRRSRLFVANGLSTEVNVACTYIDFYPEKVQETQYIIMLSKILTLIHKQYNPDSLSSVLRIDLNESVNKLPLNDFNFKQPLIVDEVEKKLIETNLFTLHFH